MRVVVLLAVLGAVLWLGWARFFQPPPGFHESNARDASRPLVVEVHADSCALCVSLGPTWTQLDARAGAMSRLVVLDVTNEERFRDTVRIARYMGRDDFLERHMEPTGTIAVFHGATREPVRVFRGERDVGAYLAAIERARTL